MGRPLSKQQFFSANALNNLKVQFHNGTASVKGYIVEQTGSKRFKCKDENGVTAICYLKDKASADLLAGEMSITFKYDDNTIQQATKIARHKATFLYNGVTQSMPWGFATSTTDGRWQVEEAGSNAAMASATNLEGDDIDGDYPVPGSSTYQLGAVGLAGIAYANIGTPFNPGANVATVANSAAGLYRTKYNGNFTTTNNAVPSTWNYNFFGTATALKSIPDTYVSWGQQLDGPGLGESLFSMEWKGYVQVPTTQNYNFYGESDDHIAMWLGTNALNAPANGSYLFASSNLALPASGAIPGSTVTSNSVTLTAGQWYPVRIWFSEHTGGCKAQIYAQGANGVKFAGSELTFAYNTVTGGYNP
jgi:hypothetical protein